MDITPLIAKGTHIIQSYGNHGFKINQTPLKGNLLVSPAKVFAWNIEHIDQIDLTNLAPLLQEKPGVEILLIGCGKRAFLLPAELRQALKTYGISVDAMDTGAACRTYNVLLSEGRNVAAAVLAVE